MDFRTCAGNSPAILLEGALGERLKREFGLRADGPCALAPLVFDPAGRAALRALWREYRGIANRHALPFLAATPTRRANFERVRAAGFNEAIILDNVRFLQEVRAEDEGEMYVGGLMGCRGDAYTGEGCLNEREARDFHAWQAELFRRAGADFLMAGILPTIREAKGIARAMAETGLPYVLSFTIQADGRLIDGTAITDAIDAIDSLPIGEPAFYMTNCVHPRILLEALAQPFNRTEAVRRRFLGIQANTSALPYAALDGAEDLKCSDPEDLAEGMLRLWDEHGLRVFGGCCGTDGRHMEAIAKKLRFTQLS